MGLLSGILSAAAPIVGSFFGGPVGGAIGGAVGGLLNSSGQPKSMTATSQQQLDPRMDKMLFGQNGSGGLLDKYQGYLDQPQSAALQGYGKSAGDYLNSYGGSGFGQIQNAASGLMQPKDAKMADLLGYAVGNQVQAPGQNNINLSGSYDSLINGQAGNNPYLTGAIQKGINQSSNAFGNMVTDAKNATQDVLGSIRGNSVLTGQYGGSRQGLAEGKAIDSMNTNLARAASQFGQNNTDAAVAAQAGAYDADRNRQLSATQGLGGQQYATAIQNANTKNAAEFMNVGNLWDASKTNAAMTNQQMQANNQATTAGAGILSGLMGQAYGTAQNADNAGINRATQVNGLLTPYLSPTGSRTETQPLYQNTAGNVVGGTMAAMGLYNQFNGNTGFNGIRNIDNYGTNIGNSGVFGGGSSVASFAPQTSMPINLPGLLG